MNEFQKFVNLANENLVPKISNFWIVHPFDIPHFSQFCEYLYLTFEINQFRCFNFLIFISYFNTSRKFGPKF